MHLAPTASKRVYQQRIGRIMRTHPRKEAGIVVDFVPKGATHNDRVTTLHALLDSDFYREGARVTPAPRRRPQRRARRHLSPAPWLVPVTPDVRRRLAVIGREWQRVDPRYLDEDEQKYWATIAGPPGPLRGPHRLRQEAHRGRRDEGLPRAVPLHVRRGEPEPAAAHDRARRPRLDGHRPRGLRRPGHDRDPGADLGEGPLPGIRTLLRALGDGKVDAPEQILARWTWKLARATRKAQDRRASAEFPEAKRLLGALANSRGHRHEENAAKLVNAARELPLNVGAALLASAEGYTPRATKLIEAARERLGTLPEVATALGENLPAPKAKPSRSRRRRRQAPRRSAQAAAGCDTAVGERLRAAQADAAAEPAGLPRPQTPPPRSYRFPAA